MITGHPPFPFFCAGLTVSPSLLLKKRLKLPKGEWLESQLIEIFRSQVPEVVEAILFQSRKDSFSREYLDLSSTQKKLGNMPVIHEFMGASRVKIRTRNSRQTSPGSNFDQGQNLQLLLCLVDASMRCMRRCLKHELPLYKDGCLIATNHRCWSCLIVI
jgi:hypothetical protein